MADRPKVNLNSVSELKIASDDAIPLYFKSLGFTQSHALTDIRLALGFSACAIAGVTFYFDYMLGFEETKQYTLYAVIAYFVINTVLTWWMWWIEGGKIYIGERNGSKIVVESYVEKYKPVYQMKVTTITNGKAQTIEAKNSFSSWFDHDGYLVLKPLHAFIRNNVPSLLDEKKTVTPETSETSGSGSAKKAKKATKA